MTFREFVGFVVRLAFSQMHDVTMPLAADPGRWHDFQLLILAPLSRLLVADKGRKANMQEKYA